MEAEAACRGGADAQGVRSIRRALDILSLLTDDTPAVSIRDIIGGDRPAEDDGPAPGADPGAKRPALGHPRRLHGRSRAVALGLPGAAELAAAPRDPGDDAGPGRPAPGDREPLRAARHQPGVRRPAGVARGRCATSSQVGDELPLWAGASAKVLLQRRARRAARPHRAPLALRRRPRRRRCGTWRPRPGATGTPSATASARRACPRSRSPVTGRSGAVVAALALSGPTLRFTAERVAEFAADLKPAAARMSERGFDHPLGPAT